MSHDSLESNKFMSSDCWHRWLLASSSKLCLGGIAAIQVVALMGSDPQSHS